MQESIREKSALLLRHNNFIIRITVRLAPEQTIGQDHPYRATAHLEISGPDLVASSDGKDAYGVLDVVFDKLGRLLERRHGLRKDRRNHPHEIERNVPIPKAD